MTRARHIPVVQPDERYEETYAVRKQIAEDAARELAAAIEACGVGADAYGKHVVYDKLGHEPLREVYCRRDGGVWSPPPPVCDERIFAESVVVTTPSGIKYETHAVMVPEGRFAEYAVCHLPRRYDVWTAMLDDSYAPRTPEQLKAAAERRRAAAIAKQEAADAAERERRRAAAERQPSLFGDEP